MGSTVWDSLTHVVFLVCEQCGIVFTMLSFKWPQNKIGSFNLAVFVYFECQLLIIYIIVSDLCLSRGITHFHHYYIVIVIEQRIKDKKNNAKVTGSIPLGAN